MTTTNDTASHGFVCINTDPSDPGIGEVVRYDQFVRRLLKVQGEQLMKLHCALGVAGEAGELADAIKREIIYEHTHTPEKKTIREAVIEECGDLRFYIQATMNMYGISDTEVLQYNATKLGKRYKDLSYSNLAAAVRADKQE